MSEKAKSVVRALARAHAPGADGARHCSDWCAITLSASAEVSGHGNRLAQGLRWGFAC